MKKKVLSTILAIALVATILPFGLMGVFAADSGTCGNGVTWEFSDGVLTISGSGRMYDFKSDAYSSGEYVPWRGYCDEITSIEIGDGVTYIGNNAFAYCTCEDFTSVTIPAGATLGQGVFYYCTNLTDVTLGNNVTVVNTNYNQFAYSFGCLQTLYIGENVKIGEYAFAGCSIENIIYTPDKDFSGTYNGCIYSYAFKNCTHLESVTIPKGTTIKPYAFDGCNSYNPISVTISDGAKVENNAFNDCTSLTKVALGNNVTITDADRYNNSAFADCSSLGTLTLGENVKIGNYAFYDLEVLNTINYNHDDEAPISPSDYNGSIGSYAFARCHNIQNVTIPDSVTSIGDHAFSGCNNLGFTEITIPAGVTDINASAFDDCPSLERISVSDNNPFYSSNEDGILFDKITNEIVIVPKGIKELKDLPESITSIADNTFRDCTSITSFTIPSHITSIGNYAFYGCTGLTSITIPATVESVGEYAFSGCTGLTSITVESKDTKIGSYAFKGCYNVTSLDLPHDHNFSKNAFEGCRCTVKLETRKGSVDWIAPYYGSRTSAPEEKDLTTHKTMTFKEFFEDLVFIKVIASGRWIDVNSGAKRGDDDYARPIDQITIKGNTTLKAEYVSLLKYILLKITGMTYKVEK